MTNEILDLLVKLGDITSYTYEKVPDQYDPMTLKTTERVEITFPSGKSLFIDSSHAVREDTSLWFGTLRDGQVFRSRTLGESK